MLSVLDLPQLQRVREAFSSTRPQFIALYTLTSLLTYAGLFATNMIAAPIDDPFVTAVGIGLSFLIGAAALAIQAALAAEAALGFPPSFVNALNNYTKALPLGLVLVPAGLLVQAGHYFGGTTGALVAGAVLLWFAPLTIMYLADSTLPAHRAFGAAILNTVRCAGDTLPLLLFNALFLTIGALTVVGVIYALPLVALSGTLVYRDIHGIEMN